MAAAGTSPALNLREKLAEFTGLKQRVSPDLVRCDFTNLVTNGTFDTDTTGWTTFNSGTLAVVSGELEVTNTIAAGGRATQSFRTVAGGTHRLSLDYTGGTAASVTVRVGTTQNGGELLIVPPISSPATVDNTFTATGATSWLSIGNNVTTLTTSLWDNITLYEADPSDDAPWLRLPYGYKVGKRGMIVRDGVVLHPSDYTEITDSGQTWIKPITAPGVSTEFSIWAGA